MNRINANRFWIFIASLALDAKRVFELEKENKEIQGAIRRYTE